MVEVPRDEEEGLWVLCLLVTMWRTSQAASALEEVGVYTANTITPSGGGTASC